MNDAAYIMSQVACALIEAMGMQAENQSCQVLNEMPKYYSDDFNRLIEKYGIHNNAVLNYLHR